MSTFRATPDDLAGLLRDQQKIVLKRSLPYPLVALMVGLALLPAQRTLATLALGASAAWAYSCVVEFRAVRPTFLWHYAWLQEEMTVGVEEEGLRLVNARGSSFMRWDGGISVHSRPDFFVIKEEQDTLAILPKKYLSEPELFALNTHAPGES
jgi:hypothetical protein